MKQHTPILSLVAIAMLLSSGSHAMPTPGLEAGIGILNTDASGSSAVTKAVFGIYAEWEMSKDHHVGFRPEILFQTSNPDFLNFPLLVDYRFDVGVAPLRPYIFAGPELGFRLSNGPQASGSFTSSNFAFDLGFGTDYVLNEKLSVGINWRYALGLTNENATGVPADDFRTRDMYFLASASYDY
jgi:opacity protein-like surface antigen